MPTVYYTATSLDGFLADPDDGLEWLDTLPPPQPSTYEDFIARVGSIAMGSATYQFILRHTKQGNPWPYEQPCWVFTTRTHEKPHGARVEFVRGPVAEAFAQIKAAAGEKDVWVAGGGDLAAQFHDAGLLDELFITVAPITLGAGKPLFPRELKRPLQLVSARALGPGFAELRYRVVRP